MAVYGYARVSTVEQNLERQIEALKEAGCQEIFMDKITGATMERPQLQKLFNTLQAGDTIIITDLTRFARSQKDLFQLVDMIKEKGWFLKSLKDSWLEISNENAYSKFLLQVMSAVSELERNLIKERQKEGIKLAKEKGIYNGRPKKYTEKNPRLVHAFELVKSGTHTIKEACNITGVSEATFYRNWKKHKEMIISQDNV